ncbi:MAG: hypothetical protein APF84_10325 [Gracilibacter sp. BRH_c7a]|nr:MAG: hypothetical protein APF84_10325 [Gracilibacter sp. BRH_c7a]
MRKSVFIEISSSEVRFLCWDRTFWSKNPELDFYVFPLESKTSPTDNSELVKVLMDFREQHLCNQKVSAYLLIPLQIGLIRDFRLPWIPKQDRDSAVGYYIEHEIPVPSGELVYYYQELEEKENEYLKVKVSAARREIISKYGDYLTEAGYRLEGVEYAVNCVGEVLGQLGDKRILILQQIKEDRIQLALFKGALLEVIREIDGGERDISQFMFSIRWQDNELPIDMMLSDGSDEADSLASLLRRKNLIKDQQPTPIFEKSKLSFLNAQGIKAYGAYGYLIKIKNGKQANLFSPFLMPLKLKLLAMMAGIFLSVLLLFSTQIWYPLYADYISSEIRIDSFQMDLANLESEQAQDISADWRKLEAKSYQDLEQLDKALRYIEKELKLTRLNYKQETLHLWAEGTDNPSISKLTSKLMADGWHDPVLVNYKYYQESISFCLRVTR